MNNALRSIKLREYGVTLCFFVFYFLFLLRYIDPAIIYSSNGMNVHGYVAAMHAQDAAPQDTASFNDPWFRRIFVLELTPEYFREITASPGGFAKLVVTLCIYSCRYPVFGALVITGVALVFTWIFSLYIRGTGGRRPLVLRFVPALLILTLCAWYELRDCSLLLPFMGALAFAVIYQRLGPASVLTRGLSLTLLFLLAWHLMQWGSLLVSLFIVIHELFGKKRMAAAIVFIAIVNGALLFLLDARVIPLDKTIRWSDFTALPGLLLAAVVIAVFNRPRGTLSEKAKRICSIAQMSLLIGGLVTTALWLCREPVNRDTRTMARTAYHVLYGQWDAVLKEKTAPLFADFPQKAGALQFFMVHAVDRALYKTGQIGEKLFVFPQAAFSYDPLLMIESTYRSGYVNWVMALDQAMDLGMVNTAEKIAGEIMERMGPYPDIIYRRALVLIAKGNTDAAAIYLGKLSGMPYYRSEVKRLLSMLDNKEALFSDSRIASMSATMDTVDYFIFNNVSSDALLQYLLQSNPRNKAAFDYLMTYYLLNGRVENAVAIMPDAPAFGYGALPRLWEEALCMYQSLNSLQASSKVSFSGLRRETIERFTEFTQAWLPMENDPKAAEKLASRFGDSYFYYSIFRHSRGTFNE